MNRKNFLKTIGMGSFVLAANPAKLIAESKTVNDVLIEIRLVGGGSIEISNNSSYSIYDSSGFLSNGVTDLMRQLIDLKDVLTESSNPLKSYNEFDCSNIFENIGNNKNVDFVRILINNQKTVDMFLDFNGYSVSCYHLKSSNI